MVGYGVMRAFGWIVAGICWFVFAVLMIAFIAFILLTPAGWFLLPFVVIERMLIRKRIRKRQAELALAYLDVALQSNQPLPQVVRAASLSESGRLRQGLTVMHECLTVGDPVADAAEVAFPHLPQRHIGLIRAAEGVGRLRHVFRRLQRKDVNDQSNTGAFHSEMLTIYPVMVIATTIAIVFWVTVFIMPKFKEIFEDFNSTLPFVTQTFIGTATWLTGDTLFFDGNPDQIPGVLLLALLFVIAVAAYLVLRVTTIGQFLMDYFVWHLPFIGGGIRGRAMADLCEVLGQSAAAGLPMSSAIEEAEKLQTNRALKRRIQAWRQAVQAGKPPDTAAGVCGMPYLFTAMMQTVSRSGRAEEIFFFLRRYYDGQFSRIAHILRASLLPITTVFIALLVAWVVVSLFMPLVTLLNNLTGTDGTFTGGAVY